MSNKLFTFNQPSEFGYLYKSQNSLNFFFKLNNGSFFKNNGIISVFLTKKNFSSLSTSFNLDSVYLLLALTFFFFLLKPYNFFFKIKNIYVYRFLNFQDSFVFFYFFNFILLAYFFGIFWKLEISFMVFSAFFILKTILLTPILYALNFKNSFMVVINSTKKKNKIDLVWSDFISTISFFLRFLVQLIRIVLILVVNNLLLEYIESFSSSLLYVFKGGSLFFKDSFFGVLMLAIRLLLENIDFFFILLIQFSAYTLVLYWLLSFLLLTNVNCFFEKIMLNFFLKYSVMQIVTAFVIFLLFFNLNKNKSTYALLYFFSMNLFLFSLTSVFLNLESYFPFVLLAEISSFFIISIHLIKENFFFYRKLKNYYLPLFISCKFFLYRNFDFFNFYTSFGQTNDFFKIFYGFNFFICIIYVVFVLFLVNCALIFFFKKNQNFMFLNKFFFQKLNHNLLNLSNFKICQIKSYRLRKLLNLEDLGFLEEIYIYRGCCFQILKKKLQ